MYFFCIVSVLFKNFSLILMFYCKFITYQDAQRVRLVDDLIFETNIYEYHLTGDW